MSDLQNLETDAQTAKKANAVAHYYSVVIEMVLNEQALLQETELHYRYVTLQNIFPYIVCTFLDLTSTLTRSF